MSGVELTRSSPTHFKTDDGYRVVVSSRDEYLVYRPGEAARPADRGNDLAEAKALIALDRADREGARKAQANYDAMSDEDRAAQRRAIALKGTKRMGASGDRI